MATIEPSIWIVVTSVISCFAVSFAFCLLFLPKIQMLCKKIVINPSEIFGGSILSKKKAAIYSLGGNSSRYSPSNNASVGVVEAQLGLGLPKSEKQSEKQMATVKSPIGSESKHQPSHEGGKGSQELKPHSEELLTHICSVCQTKSKTT